MNHWEAVIGAADTCNRGFGGPPRWDGSGARRRNLIAGWCSVSTGRSAWSRTPTWWPSWVSQRWPGGLGGRAARGQLCVQGSADHDHHDRHRLPFRRAWFCLPLIRRQSRFPSW